MKIIEWIRSRYKLSYREARGSFLVFVFFSLAFTKFMSNEERWHVLAAKIEGAVDEKLIDVTERDALKAYSMLKIFKRVDADLALKSDQTVLYRLMEEVGFTYV